MLLIVASTVIGLHLGLLLTHPPTPSHSSPHAPPTPHPMLLPLLTPCSSHSSPHAPPTLPHAPPTPHSMPHPPLNPCPTHSSPPALCHSEHLTFEASSLYDPIKYPDRKCSGNDARKFCDLMLCPPNCKLDTDSHSFSVECPVQGYPPYKTISWNLTSRDLANWEHLRPCVSFSNGNRTATFRAAKEFVELKRVSLKCIAHNGIDMLTGTRLVDPQSPSFIDYTMRDVFAEPLQMQTAGPVERNPFGNASFVCVSKSYDAYRVCKVEYTTLTLVQRCAASGLAASATCCTVDRYRSPNCSSGLQAQVLSVEHGTVYVMNVTTSLLGHFQCQVYNELVKGFQSIGDPIQVVLPQNSAEDTPPSAPNTYMYLFLVFVSMNTVLLAVLAVLAVVVGVVCYRARKKRWSTSGAEGRPFLQRNSTHSSMGSSAGTELDHTMVFVEQRMHGEGSQQLEGGRAGTEPASVRSRPHQGSLCCHSFPLVHDGRHCLIVVLWPVAVHCRGCCGLWQCTAVGVVACGSALPWVLWPVADHTD